MKESLWQLKGILEPIAQAVKCLEASQATAADVFLYWLAVLSSFEQIMKENDELSGLGIPKGVLSEIQGILNFCYQEMLEGAGKGVYMAMLFLILISKVNIPQS